MLVGERLQQGRRGGLDEHPATSMWEKTAVDPLRTFGLAYEIKTLARATFENDGLYGVWVSRGAPPNF